MNNLKLIRSTRGIVVLLVLSFLISYNSASAVLNRQYKYSMVLLLGYF